MSQLDMTFPGDVDYGIRVSASFRTVVSADTSGVEVRNIQHASPLHRFSVDYTEKEAEQIREVINLFRAADGMENSFNFINWFDYQAGGSEGVLRQIGETTYELYKRYEVNGVTFDRRILSPDSDTFRVVNLSGGSVTFTLNVDTATVTLPCAPNENSVHWIGNFAFSVRFAQPTLNVSLDRDFFSLDTVELAEVRRILEAQEDQPAAASPVIGFADEFDPSNWTTQEGGWAFVPDSTCVDSNAQITFDAPGTLTIQGSDSY